MNWLDIVRRKFKPPIAQYTSEWEVLELLMQWPWDCVDLSGSGMGTVHAKGLGRALASAVVAGCAPTEIWCNGSISVSHLKRGTFNAAGTF